jgi:hypothetical protein
VRGGKTPAGNKKRTKSIVAKDITGRKRTTGNLKKGDVCKNKQGKFVSKKASESAKARSKIAGTSQSYIVLWARCLKESRAAIGVSGWVKCKKQGTYWEVQLYKENKRRVRAVTLKQGQMDQGFYPRKEGLKGAKKMAAKK